MLIYCCCFLCKKRELWNSGVVFCVVQIRTVSSVHVQVPLLLYLAREHCIVYKEMLRQVPPNQHILYLLLEKCLRLS